MDEEEPLTEEQIVGVWKTSDARLRTATCCLNETGTMEFLHHVLASGRKFRRLSIENTDTRETPTIEVATSLPGLPVVRVLERLRLERWLPERLVIDHDTEFASAALDPGRTRESWRSNRRRFVDDCLRKSRHVHLLPKPSTEEPVHDPVPPGPRAGPISGFFTPGLSLK